MASALMGLAVLGSVAAALWAHVPDPLADVLSWPVSPVLLDKDGNLIHARLSCRQEWCLPVPLEEMGEWLPKVLVAVEDKRFYSHGGVDMLALGRAVFQNARAGRVVSGASTISSQLVRLSTPRQRTLSAKVLEFVGAWKLERSLSKARILEYYLNRAPFGGPIRGVEAASRMYFGKRAKELSLGEASLLIGLLKGPTAYRPDKNPRAALKRRQQIIAFVAEKTGFPASLTSLALEEPLPVYSPEMPGRAWHFADLVFKTLPQEGGVARSTLDMRIQEKLERALKERLRHAGKETTAAGIVVDVRTASIAAYVGNSRFNPADGKEWVDCALAPRSPGSTLKPFVYLKAMEEGHIIPATLLADTPLRLGGAAPRNFDRLYRGPVTAHTALADSLNTPAVRVLRMVGVGRALEQLREAGFACLTRDDADYGDSLVLGAGEVTVLELARAYTALANLGQDRPLLLRKTPGAPLSPARGRPSVPLEKYGNSLSLDKLAHDRNADVHISQELLAEEQWREARLMARLALAPMPAGLARASLQLAAAKHGSMPPARQLYTRAAAFLVAEILKDPGRLPFLEQLTQAKENAPVAFKTGTSYGLRDAWTAAYGPTHVVVVWFGRADGGADQRLLGLSLAAPAALGVMRDLAADLHAEQGWYSTPSGVKNVRVCALSGAAPSAFCPSTRVVPHLPHVWRTVPCSMHVVREGKLALVWPPELEDFTRKRFSREDLSRDAFIVSPLPKASYIITPGAQWQPVTLRAEGVSYPVHWYVDGEYFGEQERDDKPLYWLPSDGAHTLSLLDAKERIASAEVRVTVLGAPARESLPLLD